MKRTFGGGVTMNRKLVISVFLLFLLFLPQFSVEYFYRFSFSRGITPAKYFSMIIMLVSALAWTIFYRGRLNYTVFLLLTVYYVVILLSTAINGGNLPEAMKIYAQKLVPVFFLCVVLQLYRYGTVSALHIIVELLCLANLATMILYPNGLYLSELTRNRCFLLGHKNSITYYSVALLALSVSQRFLKRDSVSFRNVFDFGVVLLTALLSRSATGIVVAMVCAPGFCALFFNFRFLKINAMIPMCIIWALTIGVVFFEIQTNFATIIESVFERSVNLSNRTIIWGRAIQYIGKSPWIGYGYESTEELVNKLILGSTHCTLLSCMFYGGIFALLAYGLYIAVIARRITAIRETREGKFFLCVFCGVLIASIVESLETNFVVLIILVLCSHVGSIMRIADFEKIGEKRSGRSGQRKKHGVTFTFGRA